MLWFRILPFLLLASIAFAGTSREAPRKAVQQKLVKVAATIQSHEAQLSAVEGELNQARAEESAILAELDHHNQRLMEMIHYLRHATQYSPLLAMLSAPKPEDIIHSSLLLRSVTPEIHLRNQQLLEKVKTLSHVRAQLEAKQNQLRDITFYYHQERENLDALLKDHPPQNTPAEEDAEDNSEILTLVRPVAGKLIPTYKDPRPKWASFTQGVLFNTRHGAQVISPLSGTIAFAGKYAENQGKMVIVKTPNSHVVMSGLGSLNCRVGQSIIAREPIGRMPVKQPKKAGTLDQNAPQLYLEVWRQEQTINPETVLKEKKKES